MMVAEKLKGKLQKSAMRSMGSQLLDENPNPEHQDLVKKKPA